MHLKLVLSLAFLAFCSARSIDYDYIVKVADGHVTVENKVGQEVVIYVKQHVGQTGHYIQIHVSGPGVELDTHKFVNEPVSFEGQYEADALYQVFNKFSGPLDDVSYEKLLAVVAQHVQDGHVHPAVLYALQKLSPHHQNADLINPVHRDVYNTVQKLFQHVDFDQDVPLSKQGVSSFGKYGKWWGVGGVHGWNQQAYGSQYPGVSSWYGSQYPGVQQWAHQYGSQYPGVQNWAQQYGSHYPQVSGIETWGHQYGSHYPQVSGIKTWGHQYGSHYPEVSGVKTWAHQYGSDYPEVSGVKSWSHQYGSQYPHTYGVENWAHQYGSQYPQTYGVQNIAHQYGSEYPEVYGGHHLAKESVGSHYPSVYGAHNWNSEDYQSHYPVHQSYGGYSGPYSSDVYNSGVTHGYGHHFSLHKQWPQQGTWSNWQGVHQPVHHEVVAY